MPLFDFTCEAGHVEERLCSAAEATADPGFCHAPAGPDVPYTDIGLGTRLTCGKPLHQKLAAPAAFPGAASWRQR